MSEAFYKYPVEMFTADGFISRTTGEQIVLTPIGVKVYLYMLNRFGLFGDYFESYETIADACRCSKRKVQDTITEFVNHGIIVVRKAGSATKSRNVYTEINPMDFYQKQKVSKPIESEPEIPPPKIQVSADFAERFIDDFIESLDSLQLNH